MSSNIANKAFKNLKLRKNPSTSNINESEISDHLLTAFNTERKSIITSINQKIISYGNLYEFITKYEILLPKSYFFNCLIHIGNTLIENEYYLHAKFQCFQRILVGGYKIDLDLLCKSTAADQGLKVLLDNLNNQDNFGVVISAIFGYAQAEFEAIKCGDNKLVCKENVARIVSLLRFIQVGIESILKYEKYAYIIYNGSITVYQIAKSIVNLPIAKITVESLIWVSCCLETSIPLLTISNLRWRGNLYCLTCQALFNSGNDTEAEAFARRGLSKVQELVQIYELSNEPKVEENAVIITEVTIKIGLLIFKRAVFETRRRPKSYSRPKTKINFKEILSTNWPRTDTERMLVELFDSPAQQILAIVEAIKQFDHPFGQLRLPAPDNDWDILDVYAELFYAAHAIISGRADQSVKTSKITEYYFKVTDDPMLTQLTMAVYKQDMAAIDTIYTLLCWSMTYMNWEFWDNVYIDFMDHLKKVEPTQEILSKMKTLQLLSFVKKVSQKSKITDVKSVKVAKNENEDKNSVNGVTVNKDDTSTSQDANRSNIGSASSKDTKSSRSRRKNSTMSKDDDVHKASLGDPILEMARFIYDEILDSQFELKNFEQELLVECGVFLWNKIKNNYQTVIDGSLQNIEESSIWPNIGRWTYLLYVCHSFLSQVNYGYFNPITYSEISTRLTTLLEELNDKQCDFGESIVSLDTTGVKNQLTISDFYALISKHQSVTGTISLLNVAQQVTVQSIKNLNGARKEISKNNSFQDQFSTAVSVTSSHNLDLIYMELYMIYFRQMIEDQRIDPAKFVKPTKIQDITTECRKEHLANKNIVLQSLYLAQYALKLNNEINSSLMAQIVEKIKKNLKQYEESCSVDINRVIGMKDKDDGDQLPPPVILDRGSDYIKLGIDRNNIPQNLKNKLGRVRLYGRATDSPNSEVRLTDDKLPGCGTETQSLDTIYTVYNLQPNEQYIFAFAAVDDRGNFIGRGIGQSTNKILAIDKIDIISVKIMVIQLLYKLKLWREVVELSESIWPHFIELPAPNTEEYQVVKFGDSSEFHHCYKINHSVLNHHSPMSLRHFCICIMMHVDAQYELYQLGDSKSAGSTIKGISNERIRLKLCDMLLGILPAARRIKQHIMCVEIFTMISFILIPVVNRNQFYNPFIEILIDNIQQLYNLPQTIWIKVNNNLKQTIHQLLVCLGRFILRCYKSQSITAVNKNMPSFEVMKNSVSMLVQISGNMPFKIEEQDTSTIVSGGGNISQLDNATNTKNAQVTNNKKLIKLNKVADNNNANVTPSVFQASFDTFKCMMTKQAESSFSGTEDPDLLFSLLAHMSAKAAYKEVIKFSRKTRYLQLASEVMHQAAWRDRNYEFTLSVHKDLRDWLRRRNEAIIGRVVTDASNANHSGEKEHDSEAGQKSKPKKKIKYKPISVKITMSEADKQKQEAAELKALEVFTNVFSTFYKQAIKRRRFRSITNNELSARIKMNSSAAEAFLGQSLNKFEVIRSSLVGSIQRNSTNQSKFSIDITRFMLDNTGQLLPELFKENNWFNLIDDDKDHLEGSEFNNEEAHTYRSEMIVPEKKAGMEISKLTNQWNDYLSKLTLFLRRAVVLAGRGNRDLLICSATEQIWIAFNQLINGCINMKLQILSHIGLDQLDQFLQLATPSLDKILNGFELTLYFCSESLLDMLMTKSESKFKNEMNHQFIESFILRTIQILNYNKSYQKLIHLILRFNYQTGQRYQSITKPIFDDAKDNLNHQVEQYRNIDSNWRHEYSNWAITSELQASNLPPSITTQDYVTVMLKNRKTITKVPNIQQKPFRIIHKLPGKSGDTQKTDKDSYLRNLLEDHIQKPVIMCVPLDIDWCDKEVSMAGKKKIEMESMWRSIVGEKLVFQYYQLFDNTSVSLADLLQSYKKSIDLFKKNGYKSYEALCLKDVGDLYNEYSNKSSRSYDNWIDSLDLLINVSEKSASMKYLDDLFESLGNYSVYECRKIAKKFDVRTCIQIASLLTNIARFTSKEGDKRVELIIRASCFYKSIFSTTMTHPRSDIEYLKYSIPNSIDHPIRLLSNMELFDNKTHMEFDIVNMESELWYTITTLTEHGYYTMVAPLLTLYEHLILYYLPSTNTNIKNMSLDLILIRLDICIQLNQCDLAIHLMSQLLSLTGNVNLNTLPIVFCDWLQVSQHQLVFQSANHITQNIGNLQVIDKLLLKRINPNLSMKLGHSYATRLSIVQARILCLLASNIVGTAIFVDYKSKPTDDGSKSSRKITSSRNPNGSSVNFEDATSILELVSVKLGREKMKDLSLLEIKGTLLDVAWTILQPLTEDLLSAIQQEKPNVWLFDDANDAILSIEALISQSQLLYDRQCYRSSARLAWFSTKIIQESTVHIINSNDLNDFQAKRSVSKLNFPLYIKCNLKIIYALLEERGIGNITNPTEYRVVDLPPINQLILSLISECDQHNLTEPKTILLSILSQHVIDSGYDISKYQAVIKELRNASQARKWYQFSDNALMRLFQTDLFNINVTKTFDLVRWEAFDWDILAVIQSKYSESVVHNISKPESSRLVVMNAYDPWYGLWVKWMLLRVDLCAAELIENSLKPQQIQSYLTMLYNALDVQRSLSLRTPSVEVELLVLIGRLQRKLAVLGEIPIKSVLSIFQEAISIVIGSGNHIGLIKQLLIEISITSMFAASISINSLTSISENGFICADNTLEKQKAPASAKPVANSQKTKQTPISDSDKYRYLAWLALRHVSTITHQVTEMSKIKIDISKLVSDQSIDQLPLSILFDLTGPYQFGEKKIHFKDEIEMELQRMPEKQIPKDDENIDQQITRLKLSLSNKLSWSHLLDYQELLQKIINNQYLSDPSISSQSNTNNASISLNIFNHSTTTNLKLLELSQFLFDHLPEYKLNCLTKMSHELFTNQNVNSDESYFDNCFINKSNWNTIFIDDIQIDEQDGDENKPTKQYPPFTNGTLSYSIEQFVKESGNKNIEKVNVSDSEISFHFITPVSESRITNLNQSLLLFGITQKISKSAPKSDGCVVGWQLVANTKVINELYGEIHNILMLLEVAEQSNTEQSPANKKTNSKSTANKPTTVSQSMQNSSSTAFITLQPGAEISEIEFKIRLCLERIERAIFCKKMQNEDLNFMDCEEKFTKLSNKYCLNAGEDEIKLKQVPFDINIENIRSLMAVFNILKPLPISNNPQLATYLLGGLKIN